MGDAKYDVLGIGNAIVDVLARVDDAFLDQEGLSKGGMALIDSDRAAELYAAIEPERELSGGSAANTMVGVSHLGGKTAFVGKVSNDLLGDTFRQELLLSGVAFLTPEAISGPATAQCVVLVTPDAQRTMNTFLGASIHVGPEDVEQQTVADSQVTYLEGYLWDLEPAKEAFLKAAKLAHQENRSVALSLSDSFCVDRHRASFCQFVREHVDILFANEDEIKALYQRDAFEEAVSAAREDCTVAALTRGAQGAVVIAEGVQHEIGADAVHQVVDTTGAGDLFAAGFLYGYTHGLSPETSGCIGAAVAADIISQYGARPERSLREVAARHLP